MNLPAQMRRKASHSREDGYVLLFLLLALALTIIAAAAIVPTIKFQIERDREEELIHRGVQYARAIRSYYKKFGRYPTKIEDLESTNNLRFLRKRYKDPITGKDFKLLHFGEVKLTFTGGIGGGTIPGASPAGSTAGMSGPGALQTPAFGGNSGVGANPNSPFGQNQPSGQNPQGGDNTSQGAEATQSSPSQETGATSPGGEGNSGNSGEQPSGQVFGGGPIVGVVSSSKKTGYREFNHKKKYSEWQFIYDPGTDRGGLLMTPNQPQLQGFGQQGVQNPNAPNTPGGFGPGNSFGTSPTGAQNTSNSPTGNTVTTDQSNNPPQQQ
jgi:type II secretory pathway pseudopilin PulG